jgi:hypothetical protein
MNQNHLSAWIRKAIQLRFLYTASLLLQPIVLLLGFVPNWSLRGGLSTHLSLLVIVWVLSLGAIAQVLRSRLSKAFKLIWIVLQSPGLFLLTMLICQTAFIVMFFGAGTCRTTFISPSGDRSITIEDACFMDCTHTVYANHLIFEHQLGEISLVNGKVCRSNAVLTWNQNETEIDWKVRDERGVFNLR